MAQSSINFERVTPSNLNHNDRSEFIEPDYLLPEEYRLVNEILNTATEAKQLIKNLLEEVGINFQEKFNQKLQAKSYIWEAVVNLDENHDMKDLKKLVKKLEKETGFTCVQISNHNDEGYVAKDKDGKDVAHYNHHAHLTFFTLDMKNGLQLYRKDISKPERRKLKAEVEAKYALEPESICEDFSLKRKWTKNSQRTNFRIRALIRERNFIIYNKERLSSLQTMVAEELGMERGTVSVEAEAKKLGVEVVKAKTRMGHKEFKQGKKNEENNPILANKVAKVKELEVLVKNYKDAEIENEALRENIMRDMRGELERLETLLETQAHNHVSLEIEIEARAENVIWDMKVELEQEKQVLQAEVTEKVNELEELEGKNDDLEVSITTLIEEKDKKINELQGDISLSKIIHQQRIDKIIILETQNENYQKVIEEKNKEITESDEQIKELEEEVFSETWTWTANDGKKNKSKNINVVKHLETTNKELKGQIKMLEEQNASLVTISDQKTAKIDTLKKLAYTGRKYPTEFDGNKQIKSKKETWQNRAKEEEKRASELTKEIKELKELAYTGNTYLDSNKPFSYKQRSENQAKIINGLEKKIEELDKIAYYDDVDYNMELDKPVSVRSPYSQKVLELEKDKSSLAMEIEELDKFSFYEKDIWIDELEDYVTERFYYKSENKELTRELEKSKEELELAQKIIETVGKYNVPYKTLNGNIKEISDNVLDKVWQKRAEKKQVNTTTGLKLK